MYWSSETISIANASSASVAPWRVPRVARLVRRGCSCAAPIRFVTPRNVIAAHAKRSTGTHTPTRFRRAGGAGRSDRRCCGCARAAADSRWRCPAAAPRPPARSPRRSSTRGRTARGSGRASRRGRRSGPVDVLAQVAARMCALERLPDGGPRRVEERGHERLPQLAIRGAVRPQRPEHAGGRRRNAPTNSFRHSSRSHSVQPVSGGWTSPRRLPSASSISRCRLPQRR